MAFEIKKTGFTPTPKKRPEKRASYLDFIRQLPCCVTARTGVEAAHVSFAAPWYGAYGRGKGSKVSDRFALPLHPDEHRRQHSMDEQLFWQGVNISPHSLANTLFGIWSDYPLDEALLFAEARIMSGIGQAGRLNEGEW